MKRFLRHIVHSLVLTVVLFAVIRLSYDMTIGEDYWSGHTRTFILTELLLTWGCLLTGVTATPKLITYARQHGISPAIEYLLITAFATLCMLTIIFISHSIDPETVRMRLFILPLIVSSLFSCLYYSYCVASERKRQLTEQILTLEKTRNRQLETELRLLRAQYHPRFLFNMLNTIYVQIDETNEAPRHTIECLSEVLRYQLYSPETPVDVESELDAMKKYIELCRLRASRSLRLKVEIGHLPPGMKIYPLLLIPLIENAFKHVGGTYDIRISFGMSDAMMQLRVSNTVSPISKPTPVTGSGLGLDNLRKRIELLYPGNQHKLIIERNSDCFTADLCLKPLSAPDKK